GAPMRSAPQIVLNESERAVLESWTADPVASASRAQRARIILLCASGKTNQQVARDLGVHPETVIRWRRRFLGLRLEGIRGTAPRPHPRSPRLPREEGEDPSNDPPCSPSGRRTLVHSIAGPGAEGQPHAGPPRMADPWDRRSRPPSPPGGRRERPAQPGLRGTLRARAVEGLRVRHRRGATALPGSGPSRGEPGHLAHRGGVADPGSTAPFDERAGDPGGGVPDPWGAASAGWRRTSRGFLTFLRGLREGLPPFRFYLV
ncbi:hypothetical protein B2A_00346, partial [mine drainage metagenome]